MAIAGAFGAAIARERGSPIYGTIFAGVIVGLGGGMLRDMLISTQPVAIADWRFIPIVAAAAVVGALLSARIMAVPLSVLALQGLSLGLLVAIGAQRAIQAELAMPVVIFLGMITATAGGIILDAMTARQSAVLAQNYYFATAAFIGAVVFWAISANVSFFAAVVVTVPLVTALRVLSVRRGWKAPEWPGRRRGDDADAPGGDATTS